MARGYYDFLADRIGARPTLPRWRFFGQSGTIDSYRSLNVGMVDGRPAVRLIDNGWGSGWQGFVVADMPTHVGAGPWEIYARVKIPTPVVVPDLVALTRDSDWGYCCADYGAQLNIFRDYPGYANGIAGTSTVAWTWTAGWVHMAMARLPDGSLRAKVWKDTAPELPWGASSTSDCAQFVSGAPDTNYLNITRFGFAIWNSNAEGIAVSRFGVGTGPDRAPRSRAEASLTGAQIRDRILALAAARAVGGGGTTVTGAAIGAAVGMPSVVGSRTLSASAQAAGVALPQAIASILTSAGAQAAGIGAGFVVGSSLVLVTGTAQGVSIGSGGAVPSVVRSGAAQGGAAGTAAASPALTVAALAQAIGAGNFTAAGALLAAAAAQGAAEAFGAFSTSSTTIVQGTAYGVGIGASAAVIARQLSAAAEGASIGAGSATGSRIVAAVVQAAGEGGAWVTAAVVVGAQAQGTAESLARAIGVLQGAQAGPSLRVVTIDSQGRTVVVTGRRTAQLH